MFWQEGNEKTLDKARVWLNKAVQYDATLGDAWANLYKFEVQHGTEEKQQVRSPCNKSVTGWRGLNVGE